jgi:hypothetical protein
MKKPGQGTGLSLLNRVGRRLTHPVYAADHKPVKRRHAKGQGNGDSSR